MGNLSCYAVVTPGLEVIAADELNELAAHEVKVEGGGVSFVTTMDGLFRINLRSRIATRILIRLARFRALSFPELYNKSRKVAWERYLGPQVSLNVRASCHASKLMHSGRAESAVADAVHDRLGRMATDSDQLQQLLLRIDNNDCTLSIDSSGERLDRRGYRVASGLAPLRETIAASILRWMDWQPDEPLLTPMCGSGTFAIEAAWLAGKRASGLKHDFPFLAWPCCNHKRWQRAVSKAQDMSCDIAAVIIASELDAGILAQARRNAAAAGASELIRFNQQDIRSLTAPEGLEQTGLMVCNPPYGNRIKGDAGSLYASLGRVFKQRFSGWRMAVIVPDQACEKALGLPVKRRIKIKHGGKWVHALHL